MGGGGTSKGRRWQKAKGQTLRWGGDCEGGKGKNVRGV